ncbi:site-specific integrase [Pseudodesulfovibrio indicus]|uniref:Tyr recombinase domain-containing protein n=1 Tax=Pseudodesulfovibrio indicus TaxID=1716143 RepID=A0AA94TKC8_9BACT|nr:site-specific integrase [Pseudodesulfovibrio indicus]TDT91763.1 hypothetical protein EDC59_101162 [Pseudodesulfovibrio indicus]
MKQLQENLFYELPRVAFTLDGQTYDPREDTWMFYDGVHRHYIHFNFLREIFTDALFNSTKRYFIWRVANYTFATSEKYYTSLKKFVQSTYCDNTKIASITSSEVISFISTHNNPNTSAQIKTLCCHYHKLGLTGVTKETYEQLKDIKVKHPPPHTAVKTCDPRQGPFTEAEFQSLSDAVHEAYLNHSLDDNTFLLWLLLANLGQRRRQIAWLKVCDFITEHDGRNSIRFFINMPMDKQGHVEPRTDFRRLQIHTEFAAFIQTRIEEIKQDYLRLGFDEDYDLNQLPLLPKWTNTTKGRLKYHMPTETIAYLISNKLLKHTGKILNRQGENLNINSRRFRHTRGTNLMLNGASLDSIAYNLCHSRRSSAKSYIELGAKHAEIVDKGVAPYHKPVVEAFNNKIFKRPNITGTRQTYIPVGAAQQFEEAGLCVKPTGCAIYLPDSNEPETFLARVPFSCYRCLSFNAWDNIEVHKEHLEILEQERDRSLQAFKEDGPARQPGMAVALDPTIIAIKSVIARIEAGTISEFEEMETDMVDSF